MTEERKRELEKRLVDISKELLDISKELNYAVNVTAGVEYVSICVHPEELVCCLRTISENRFTDTSFDNLLSPTDEEINKSRDVQIRGREKDAIQDKLYAEYIKSEKSSDQIL